MEHYRLAGAHCQSWTGHHSISDHGAKSILIAAVQPCPEGALEAALYAQQAAGRREHSLLDRCHLTLPVDFNQQPGGLVILDQWGRLSVKGLHARPDGLRVVVIALVQLAAT